MTTQKIYTGAQLLAILAMALVPASANEARVYEYRAVEGDTLIKLANRFLIRKNEWQILQKNNAIDNPNRVPVGSVIRIPAAIMRSEPAPAVVTASRGRVESSARNVVPGLAISEGDTVKTGDDGFVTIKLADGSTLTVQSKSSVRIETARQLTNTGGVSDSVVRLDAGRVETRAAVQKGPAARYEIRTPTSNMGVRGTVFRVAADDSGKKGQGEVVEGLVGVESTTLQAAPLSLAAGFGSIVEAGKSPSPPVALLPPPDLASLNRDVAKADVSFTYAPLTGAVGYRAQVARDATFTNLVADALTAASAATFKDLPDGELYFRARGVDGQGLEGKDAVHAFRVKARPFAPALLIPVDKARLSAGLVKFSWKTAPEAATYRVQIAERGDFVKTLFDKASLPTSAFAPENPLKSGLYAWRVASVPAKGDAGPWSETFTFEIRTAAPLLKPRRDSRKVILELDGGIDQPYQIQVARDERFTRMVLDRTVRGPEADLSTLALNVYYVRIRMLTSGADGAQPAAGEWSETGMLEVYANDWWLSTHHLPAR